MQAFKFRLGGTLKDLEAVQCAKPKPGPHQVLVRMRAVSLNYRGSPTCPPRPSDWTALERSSAACRPTSSCTTCKKTGDRNQGADLRAGGRRRQALDRKGRRLSSHHRQRRDYLRARSMHRQASGPGRAYLRLSTERSAAASEGKLDELELDAHREAESQTITARTERVGA